MSFSFLKFSCLQFKICFLFTREMRISNLCLRILRKLLIKILEYFPSFEQIDEKKCNITEAGWKTKKLSIILRLSNWPSIHVNYLVPLIMKVEVKWTNLNFYRNETIMVLNKISTLLLLFYAVENGFIVFKKKTLKVKRKSLK